MSTGSAAARVAATFAALGDPVRLGLIARLSTGEVCSITALAGETSRTRQAVTKHLHVLERAGLVRNVRVGRESHFAFEPAPVDAARAYLDAASAHWGHALARLRSHVES